MSTQAASNTPKPRIVDEVAVLDLDRTLLDSSAVTALLMASLVQHGVNKTQLDAALRHIEAQTGNSFYLFDFIKDEFPDVALDAVIEGIMGNELPLEWAGMGLLCDRADELIYALEDRNIPHVVLTYGEESYQEFKIALFRRLINRTDKTLPAIITTAQNKARWVTDEWFDEAGKLGKVSKAVIGEELQVQSAVIIDDKAENLKSTDVRVRGILVDNSASGTQQSSTTTAEVARLVSQGASLVDIANRNNLSKNAVQSTK